MKKIVILSILLTSVIGLGSCQKKEPAETNPKPINLDLKSKSIIEADNGNAIYIGQIN